MQYCQEHGIGVPEDGAIAGFDHLPEGQVSGTDPAAARALDFYDL